MHGPFALGLRFPSMALSLVFLSSSFVPSELPAVVRGDLGGLLGGEAGELDGLVGAGPSGVRGPLTPR